MADFQARVGDFSKLDCKLAAVSTDAEPEASKTVTEHALTFPVAFGADAAALAALTGAFWEERRHCLQATGFILKADGTVAQALYSTGPIGRYTAAEALKILEKLVDG